MSQATSTVPPTAPLDPAPAPERPRRPDRRRLLGKAAMAAFAGLGATASVQRRAKASPPSVSADVDPGSVVHKLVNRLTFGFTEYEHNLARTLGYQGYLEHHLNISDADEDPAVLAATTGASPPLFPWLNATHSALYTQAQNNTSPIAASLVDSTIFRQAFSRKQLFERMVEFWSDHFNIDINTDNGQWLKLIDDRTVIRPNALGYFETMLNASARSPSMLNYLDNDVSRVNNINENYSRELKELHTLSVNGGYTQADVIAVARCLTGWTWWSRNPPTPDEIATFRYNANNHDNASKTLSPVFNLANPTQPLVIPAGGGMNDGQTVLNILAAHPTTASFIATKLCRRFIGEDCPAAVISAVAAAYMASTPKGDIKAMLRVMLDPNVLADAPLRLKRPGHLIASALRAFLPGPASLTAFATIKNHYRTCGHALFAWSPPDGYPDTNIYWSGLLLPRWNFCAAMMTNTSGSNGGINGVTVDAAALAAFFPTQTTRDQVIDKLNQSLFGGTWPEAERNAVRSFLPSGTLSNTNKRDAVGLAFSSPTFQYI